MRRRIAAVVLLVLVPAVSARVVLGGGSAAGDLRSLPAARADARVDATVSDADVAGLAAAVERSVEYVEGLFEHTFREPPRLVVFGTTASFSTGLSDIFSYSEGDVARSASSYGGLYDHATSTIAVNLQAVAADDRASTIEHELTHYVVREITGARPLPAWFEEGIATLVERHQGASRWPEEDALVGRAVATSGRITLEQVESLADWHAAYPRFGQSLYQYAKAAVSLMRAHVGWPGMLGMLAAVAGGQTFADAYRAAAGESVSDLDSRIRQDRAPSLVWRRLPNGDAQYTFLGSARLAEEKVTIGGKSSYAVTFTVGTDDLGMYRGTFGATAPPGTYQISAAGGHVELVTERR